MRRKVAQDLQSRRYARQIQNLVESIEARCMAVDGPVTPTHKEIQELELKALLDYSWKLSRRVLDVTKGGRR